METVVTRRPADADQHASAPSLSDGMIRSGRQSDETMWMRIPVSIVVSGFLFVFMGPVVGLGWLAAVLAAEGVSFLVLARLIRSGGAWQLVNLISVWAISACWIVFSIMLWSTGEEIARIATIVTLLTAAVYGVTSAYMSRSLLLALIGPQLLTLAIILITNAWSSQEPAAALVTTAATIGACAVVALNGVTLHLTDRRLMQTNADLVAMNARISELARQAEARSEARTDLLANVSHELRTPLNGVIGSAEQLAKTQLSPEQRLLVQIMRSSGEMLDRLAGDLLDLSAIEAGQSSLKASAVDLGHLIETITDQHRNAIETRGLGLKVQIDTLPAKHVITDAVRLQQVLGNLLANAIKYTAKGMISVSLRPVVQTGPKAGAGHGWAEITVEDTGPGLGTSDTEALFTRYHRGGDGSPMPPGLGLGLTIARELTEALGGSLHAEARPVGSAFVVTLPLVPASEPLAGTADEVAPDTGPGMTAGLRVLVADDHDVNRQLLTVVLESFGASVEAVSDGATAVRGFSIEPFDLVVLDLMMPGLDGLAAAREMRMVEDAARSRRTPIILLTALHSAEIEEACVAAGCDLLLTKPIVPAKLAEAISRLALAPSA